MKLILGKNTRNSTLAR